MINFIAIATMAVTLTASTPKAPQWEQSYGKALEATRAGQDPLLVVLDKPNSDDARLEPALLSEDKTEGDTSKLLSPYRLCHVDVSPEYGQKVAKAFHVKTFPHVAIIDKTGSVVIYKKSGQINENEWKQMLKSHKSGERPTTASSEKPFCPNCQRSQF